MALAPGYTQIDGWVYLHRMYPGCMFTEFPCGQGGAGAKSGLKVGDALTHFNGTEIKSKSEFARFVLNSTTNNYLYKYYSHTPSVNNKLY